MEKRSLFIEQTAQRKWWYALQRGETTAEHITKYFANRESKEQWRNVFKSYYIVLRRSRMHYGENYVTDDSYRKGHDVITNMFLADLRENYTTITAEIVERYITIYDPVVSDSTETPDQTLTL